MIPRRRASEGWRIGRHRPPIRHRRGSEIQPATDLVVALIPVLLDDGELVIPHRPWQQLILKHRLESGISLQSRTRFEHRFPSTGSDVGFRIREFVRFSMPISEGDKVGFVDWDEPFVGLNETHWGARPGLDQNRIFVVPYLLSSGKTRLELGNLFPYLDREPQDTIGHVLATNFFWAL